MRGRCFRAATHARRGIRPSPVSFSRPPLRLSHLLKIPPFNTITTQDLDFKIRVRTGDTCSQYVNYPMCSLTGLPFAQAQLIPALIAFYYLLPVLKKHPFTPWRWPGWLLKIIQTSSLLWEALPDHPHLHCSQELPTARWLWQLLPQARILLLTDLFSLFVMRDNYSTSFIGF